MTKLTPYAGNSHQEVDKRELREAAYTVGRRVTIAETDPSTAWNTFAQRQEQRRRARARTKPQKYGKLVLRATAQTGTWTPTGRGMRRPLPRYRSSPVPARSGRRTRGGLRGFFVKILGVLAGVVGLSLAASFAFTSNAFRVEQVNVIGTHNDGLIRSIQHMGMRGQNIFLVNVPALKTRIEASPFVSSATINKQWPNQLTVSVVERAPVLLWKTPEGAYSVDSQGVVIASVNETFGADRLKTVIASTNNLGKSKVQGGQPGKAVQPVQPIRAGARLNPAEIGFALEIFKRVPQVIGIDAFKLYYNGTMYRDTTNGPGTPSSKGSFIVESTDGWIAYLGSVDDANPLENRLVELQQILAMAREQHMKLATVDLRYGLRPVYTLKS